MANIQQAVDALTSGEVIAYPTEGVFGVGCDPDNIDAIQKLLAVKERPVEKGLILIADSYQQLRPYIDESQLTHQQLEQVQQTWPGPFTWIMPASDKVSPWLSGAFDTIAVRVTDHPLVRELCLEFGKPVTSTSANLSGMPSCMNTQQVTEQLGDRLACILKGETGGRDKPSEIRDARTQAILRQG
ncbi:L-threonylcarbamoyladenylate synthase [Vibrio hippocampi]|uniref:Threonylcarbamoyl-AMP synthase n=1 Tax=Vibrio hippocampi TaxID=654686 RepID=A0ABM8ZE80_9VIBR|nr:L-threonylcarbamoyladenylate synthase [Vibrio hippocampi]CAH0524242.1 Threonylcarbamoyl-AMP synthase [Vibrio hippocampi]